MVWAALVLSFWLGKMNGLSVPEFAGSDSVSVDSGSTPGVNASEGGVDIPPKVRASEGGVDIPPKVR